ncbi:MAG: hypothetical protein ACE5JH_02745 [Acidobacteriota bacterium]
MNSSKTWKSGETCRVTGRYRCRTCELDGRETVLEFRAGTILPMCDLCPGGDATYTLLRASETVAARS